MMRSMFSGVSGLRNHQIRMDVIGNNIANVNTVGYKTSRVTFQEALSLTLRGGIAPRDKQGGMNPQQIGLGTALSSIDVIHSPGTLQSTGVNTDLAIQGNGFFVVSDGRDNYYTRAGNFSMDPLGRLVFSNGMQVQGWMAKNNVINTGGKIEGISLPINSTMAPKATTSLKYNANLDCAMSRTLSYSTVTVGGANVSIKLTPTGNLNEWEYQVSVTGGTVTGDSSGIIRLNKDGTVASVSPGGGSFTVDDGGGTAETFTLPAVGSAADILNATTLGNDLTATTAPPSYTTTVQVFDSLGNAHTLTTTFTNTGDNFWDWVTVHDGGLPITNDTGTLSFNNDGELLTFTGGPLQFTPPGAATLSIVPDFSTSTQYAAESSASWSQDGYATGYLEGFNIDSTGTIIGVFTNGLTEKIAQLAVATFSNPGGLHKMGDALFAKSNNSGEPQINPSGVGGSGKISPGSLEMSNVDLSQEFTDMIITQRGFQANSRIITTSDEMLQELVNLKR